MLAIVVIVLTLVLWVLSHKYFRFIYFGNLGRAIIGEILTCFFLSIILVAIAKVAFGGVVAGTLGFIGRLFRFIFKAVAICVGVVIVLGLIYVIANKVKESKDSDKKDRGSY